MAGSLNLLMAGPGGDPIGGIGSPTATGTNSAFYSSATFQGNVWVNYHPYRDNFTVAFEASKLINGRWVRQTRYYSTATMQGTINGMPISGSKSGSGISWVINGLGPTLNGQVTVIYEGVRFVINVRL